jgi:hypothetical protein
LQRALKGTELTESTFPQLPVRWHTVEQIRKQQRMRRHTVVAAMLSGELPCEQRGRIRCARVSDVETWEERRLNSKQQPVKNLIHPDLIRSHDNVAG